ncbi:unnamed protein product, partial [Laminaria digitata]
MGLKGASYLALASLALAAGRGTSSSISSSPWGMRGYKQLAGAASPYVGSSASRSLAGEGGSSSSGGGGPLLQLLRSGALRGGAIAPVAGASAAAATGGGVGGKSDKKSSTTTKQGFVGPTTTTSTATTTTPAQRQQRHPQQQLPGAGSALEELEGEEALDAPRRSGDVAESELPLVGGVGVG